MHHFGDGRHSGHVFLRILKGVPPKMVISKHVIAMYTEVCQVFSSKKGVPPFILHQPQFYEIQLLSVPPPIVIGFTFHLRSLHSKHSYIFNLGLSKESTICFHHFRGRDLPNWFSQNLWKWSHPVLLLEPRFPLETRFCSKLLTKAAGHFT